MGHICNPNSWETEAGGLWVWGKLGLYCEKPCLENETWPNLKQNDKQNKAENHHKSWNAVYKDSTEKKKKNVWEWPDFKMLI